MGMFRFFFKKIKNRKTKHNTSPNAQKKETKQNKTLCIEGHNEIQIRCGENKNSPNRLNSMLRNYYMQKLSAKTKRVKILNSMKRAVMVKAHTLTDSYFSYKSCHVL